MYEVTLIGIDLGKHSFHLHAQEATGRMVFRKKLSRQQLLRTLANVRRHKSRRPRPEPRARRASRIECLRQLRNPRRPIRRRQPRLSASRPLIRFNSDPESPPTASIFELDELRPCC
jgi:hypothetical protein